MKTSIVILTYNKLDYTIQCIESIRQYTTPEQYELIVVDNHSSDGTVDWLKAQSDIITIYNRENLGFPKGCNQGIEIATGDNILLLNNDTIVTKNWLDNLIVCLYSDKSIGAVGAITNSCSYYQKIKTHYTNLAEMQQFAEELNVSNPGRWEERLKLVGYCMLIKKSAIDKVGLLDERFTPGNYEDDDFSLRLRRAGFRLMLCRDCFIHHYGSVSFSEAKEGLGNLLEVNKKKFVEKWGIIPVESEFIHYGLITMINKPKAGPITVLDMCSGRGATLLNVRNEYKDAILYGIEENRDALIDLKTIADYCGTQDEMMAKIPSNSFDYIFAAKLPSDMDAAIELIRKYRGYLKSDGHLLVEIGNVTHYKVVQDLVRGIYNHHRKSAYSLNEILWMFQKAGFQEPELSSFEEVKSSADINYINQLCHIHNIDTPELYKIKMFYVRAGLNKTMNSLSSLLEQFIYIDEIEPIIEEILEYDREELVSAINLYQGDKVGLFNKIAVGLYKLSHYDYSIMLLQKAYELDYQNVNTLYNIACIQEQVGELEAAYKWLSLIQEADRDLEIQDYLNKLELQISNIQMDDTKLKYLLRRIENDIEKDNSLNQVLEMLEQGYSSFLWIILGVIEREIIDKDNLLNLLVISCLDRDSLNEYVIPLLQKSLELNPQNDDALFNLGMLMYQCGEYEGALYNLSSITHKDNETILLIQEIRGTMVHAGK